ncbi:TPA: hypothetical protein ACHYYP_002070 [Escherichia coli]
MSKSSRGVRCVKSPSGAFLLSV